VAAKKSNGAVEDLRIGLTAVNPFPLLLENPMARLSGGEGVEVIRKLAMRTAKPLKTSASTMDYRRHMIGVMLRRALEKLEVR